MRQPDPRRPAVGDQLEYVHADGRAEPVKVTGVYPRWLRLKTPDGRWYPHAQEHGTEQGTGWNYRVVAVGWRWPREQGATP